MQTKLPGAEECVIIQQRLTAQGAEVHYARGDVYTAAVRCPIGPVL